MRNDRRASASQRIQGCRKGRTFRGFPACHIGVRILIALNYLASKPAESQEQRLGQRLCVTYKCATRYGLENERTMITKRNNATPNPATPMSRVIHRILESSSGIAGCARLAHLTMTTGRRMPKPMTPSISTANRTSASFLKRTSPIGQIRRNHNRPAMIARAAVSAK